MKRTISMIGTFAALALGFLFAAPAAQAAEGYISAVNKSGVMCEPRVGGSLWPVNGTNASNARFFYCGTNTAANRGSIVYTSLKGVSSLEGTTSTLMTNNNVIVFVLDSPAQYATMSGNDPEDTYNAQLTTSALSLFDGVDGATDNVIVVYERTPDQSIGYPVLLPTPENFQRHDAKHEAGHHFDLHYGGGTRMSHSTTYDHLYNPDDLNYEAANNPTHSVDFPAYSYWWGNKEELFAEEFAIVNGSLERNHDAKTSLYFRCTKAYVFGLARNQAVPSSYPAGCTP